MLIPRNLEVKGVETLYEAGRDGWADVSGPCVAWSFPASLLGVQMYHGFARMVELLEKWKTQILRWFGKTAERQLVIFVPRGPGTFSEGIILFI